MFESGTSTNFQDTKQMLVLRQYEVIKAVEDP